MSKKDKRTRKDKEESKLTTVRAKSENQRGYLKSINDNDITFCIGPAGTGKTFLCVYLAAQMLQNQRVNKIVLCRPVVPAGEDLGYLPGNVDEKLDPYIQPLYDAFSEFLGFETLKMLIEEKRIEISALSFMRGRTFNNAMVILDEAQNATIPQMKLFLTRLGYGSKMVINGDITQIDLENANSGLMDACKLLQDVPEIGWSMMDDKDIVRHHLVRKIVQIYEKREAEDAR